MFVSWIWTLDHAVPPCHGFSTTAPLATVTSSSMVVVKVTETTSPPRSCVRRRVTPGDRDVSHIALYAGYCGIPFLDFVLTYLYKLISESTMDIYLK